MPDWKREVLPVLQAVHSGIQSDSAGGAAGFFTTEEETVNSDLGRSSRDRRTAAVLRVLSDEGYIKANWSMGDPPNAFGIELTEKGSQYVAGWPARPGEDMYRALIAALDQRIGASPTRRAHEVAAGP